MTVYEYEDYKSYLRDIISSRAAAEGRGTVSRLAEHLSVSPAMISQVLRGEKNFSAEMALEVGEYFLLRDKELDYFLLLVDAERAGSYKLREKLTQKIKLYQEEAKKVTAHFKRDVELTESQKAEYYSSWIFAGVRNVIATKEIFTIKDLHSELKVEPKALHRAIDFLINTALIRQVDGKFLITEKSTFIPQDSPLVLKHHQNWRLHGMRLMDQRNESDLFFTAPLSTSRAHSEKIRSELLKLIKNLSKEVVEEEAEVVRCVGIDFFDYTN